MRLTTRQTLKHCLIAVAATLAGLLAMGGAAQAAVTAAPDITATPVSPNTTKAVVSFTYKVGAGETSTATTLRYYCRVYDTDGTPPAAGTGWSSCGTTTSADPQPASKTYTQANGNWTFEVAVRETTVIGTQGPIASSNWTQNIAPPAGTPMVTSQPENPTDLVKNKFEYTAAAGDENLVDRFQCRLDSSDAGAWTSCLASGQTYSPGNGEHSFEVRAGNIVGWGPPSESVTWTVDVANPDPSVRIAEAASGSWSGTAPSGGVLIQPVNVGDVNDDGVDDLAIPNSGGEADGLTDIVFGKRGGFGNRTLGTQGSEEGFRIRPVPGGFSPSLNAVHNAGDQNGDGIDDLIVMQAAGFAGRSFAVVYGGMDVKDLPPCPSGPSRCLNLADITPDQGYELTSDVNLGGTKITGGFDGGDFDGDGTDDLVFASGPALGKYFIVKGKARAGSIDIQDLPDDEVLDIAGGAQSGAGSSVLGDIDGDGRDDVFLMDDQSGISSVLYGRAFGEGDFDLTAMDPDDGFRIYGPALTGLFAAGVGDFSGDGLPDLGITMGASGIVLDEEQTFAVYDTPRRGSGDSLVVGPDMDPATGYVVNRGGPNDMLLGDGIPPQAIGDLNNDGIPDALVGAARSPVDGFPNTGSAYVVFGQNPRPDSPLGVGPSLTPDVGVGLLGKAGDNDYTSSLIASAGDLDGDGLTDFAVGMPDADPNGVSNAGTVYIVPGKNLINQVKTGKAAGVANTSAVLNAGLSTNNRDSQVWFEYGTTDSYGSSTDPESFEASNNGDAASAAIGGLAKNTEYHYRAVAKNALGLVRYGDDRTFTTTNDANPGGDPCVENPGAAGCAKYCEVHPTAMGCPDYDWCANNPGKCNSGGGKTKARLALISTTKRIAIKRGRKGVLRVAVVNTGGKAAKGVKVCVKAPKRLVRVKRCVKVGKLGSGKSRIVKVKVKAKRKRGKAVLKLTANGSKLSAKRARARVVVR